MSTCSAVAKNIENVTLVSESLEHQPTTSSTSIKTLPVVLEQQEAIICM